ncbi:MAG: HypC/HybG/HupF family hydrogenase formation chaperone [Thermoprotei archaeon]
MCWGVPARVISIDSDVTATVDFLSGTLKKVVIGVDDLKVGDFVIVHAGVIISKITKEDVIENINFIAEQIRETALMTGEDADKAVKEFLNMAMKILGE